MKYYITILKCIHTSSLRHSPTNTSLIPGTPLTLDKSTGDLFSELRIVGSAPCCNNAIKY